MSSNTTPTNPGPTLLSAIALGHDYDELVAVERLDLNVGRGELVALVGPNGAGKTTLLAMTAGLLEPSHGEVLIDGFLAGSVEARAAVSYIPDTPVLYEDLSLNEHLEYVARLHGADDWQSRGPSLLRRLGLDEWGENLPPQFSHGMRQKASIAVGLIRPFALLLADEPFDGLDPPSRSALIALLREACDAGSAVVVSTHRTEVLEVAHRCVALEDGQLTYDGPPDGFALDRNPSPPTSPTPTARRPRGEAGSQESTEQMSKAATREPGWYANPSGSGQRYWDGAEWTPLRRWRSRADEPWTKSSDPEPSVRGLVVALSYVAALLFVPIGFALGVYLLVKRRVGHGIAVTAIALGNVVLVFVTDPGNPIPACISHIQDGHLSRCIKSHIR